MYASIDLAMDKIERQLRRYKERLKHHHGQERVHHRQDLVAHLKVRHDVVELPNPENAPDPKDASPRVIKTNDLLVKRMSVDEAIMQMDLMNNDFLVFTNSTTTEMNVVYRRKDGHYGLIEASGVDAARKAAG
jgi:putative sigma-54 modulation protein